MGKSLLDLVVDDTAVSKNGTDLHSLVLDESTPVQENVKKKETPSFQSIPQSIDLRTGLPASLNGGENGQITPSSKYPSPLLSDTNPYNQIIKSGTNNNAKVTFDDSKAFLDKDIQRQFDESLSNPAINGEQDKFSLQNAGGEPEKNTIQSITPQLQQQVEKQTILNSPEALKEYRKKRQTELDKSIADNEKAAIPYETGDLLGDPTAKYAAATGVFDNTEAQLTANAIKDYQKQLNKSIAATAKASVANKYLNSNVPIDLKQVGNEYLKTIGDPQINDDDEVLANVGKEYKSGVSIKNPDGTITAAENNKKDIDLTRENIQYKLYQTGANVMSDFFSVQSDNAYEIAKPKIETLSVLFNKQEQAETKEQKDLYQRQINSFLGDESVQNYLNTTRDALGYYDKSQTAIDQFPQVKRQKLRQQVNDVYMDRITDVSSIDNPVVAYGISSLKNLYHSLVGSTPDEKDIKAIAKTLGINEKEVQSIADEKTGGLFGESPSGIRVSGLLQGLAKGTDEQLAKSLMGVRRFLDNDNVESKNRILQDKLNVYNTEANKNVLKDKLGQWNINPFSIFNTMGRGVGQTAVFALPTLATGGIAAEGSVAEKLIEGATTIGSGYAGSYEDAYKEAAQYTNKEDLRRSYANITAFENALPELLLSPADIAKKASGFKKAIGKEAFETFAKDATEKGIKEATQQRMASAVKEFANVIGAENIEEAVTNVTNNVTKQNMFGVEMSPNDWINQAIETAVQTTITTLPLAIGAGINGTQDVSDIRKEGLFEAGNEPDLYKSKLQGLFDNGVLNQQQLNERTQVVNTMQNIVANVNKTTKADGSPLSYEEKRDLAAQQFRIQNNEATKKNGNVLAAQVQHIEDDTQEALLKQNEILFGTSKPLEESTATVAEKIEEPIINEDAGIKTQSEQLVEQPASSLTISNEKEETKVINEQPTAGVGAVNANVTTEKSINPKEALGEILPTARKEQKVSPKSVLERPEEEISIDDIISEIANLKNEPSLNEADISNESLKSKDPKEIEGYVSKSKSVLENLYPNAKLEVFDNTKDFEKAGGESGTRGYAIMGKNGEHRVLLNLEQIREDNSGKTAVHEVIHPIVYDAFGVNKEKLIPIWNEIATDMEKVPGMQKVFEHIQWYNSDKIAAEGLTETLTQIATGNISLDEVPKSTANKIIDTINKLFQALGINIKLNSIEDFRTLSEKIKQSFDTGSAESLKDVVKGGNIDKFIADFERLSAKDISGERLTRLTDLLHRKINSEIKNGNLTEEQANKIYEKIGVKSGVANKEPTTTQATGKEGVSEEVGKSILHSGDINENGDLTNEAVSKIDKVFPKANNEVDGRTVREKIPNTSSIDSSLTDYETLGVREVPFSAFPDMGELKYHSKSEKERTQRLAAEIKESGEINPLIVVLDEEGAYVLEGEHRFDALRELDAKSFPALVVVDKESISKILPKEQNISSQSNINENDRQNIERVRGEKRIGEESIQTKLDESASRTAVGASGILQTQEREIENDNRTPQQIAEAEKDYDNREQQVRGYARSENIPLTDDEIDHATALVDEDTTPKEAITHVQEETKRELAEAGKKMADRIRQLKILKGNKAYATIFALPIAVYDTAIAVIANSVELSGNLAQAIQDGINYIKSQKDLKDWEDDGGHFAKHIEDFVAGEKPKLKVQVEAEKEEPTAQETEKEKTKEAKKELDNYDLTTSTENNKFLSGETWEDIFGEQPEGSQTYAVQKLTDMLQDGKKMIAIAQEKWGNDIMDYGRKLFSYIQNMEARSNNAETNKKAVLLATFLGEIKEAIVNNPNRANEIRKLEAVVLDYYQHYMNIKGKQVVAGRLLRLYRDKYIGDAFANKILEENQIRGRDAFQQAEKDVKITDEVAVKPNDTITEEEKKKEDNADKKRKKDADKKQDSKKSMSTTEAQQRANDKLKEIQDKLGDEKEKGLIAKINDLIKKINCP